MLSGNNIPSDNLYNRISIYGYLTSKVKNNIWKYKYTFGEQNVSNVIRMFILENYTVLV